MAETLESDEANRSEQAKVQSTFLPARSCAFQDTDDLAMTLLGRCGLRTLARTIGYHYVGAGGD